MAKHISKKTLWLLILIMVILLISTVIIVCLINSEGSAGGDENTVGGDKANLEFISSNGYVRIRGSIVNMQFGKDYIYFNGENRGVVKYDLSTGEVTDICTDPLCQHIGSDSSCLLATRTGGSAFFRVFSNSIVYNALQYNPKFGKSTLQLYHYDFSSMENKLLNDNASSFSLYCISENYIYFQNVVTKDDTKYYNHRQVNIATGESRVFGKESAIRTEYVLIGAYGGKLYATDADYTATYICNEEEPGEFVKIWDYQMAFIFTNGEDIFFKSKDPDAPDSDNYYFYHTDYDGNVISKYELNGGMHWGDMHDGRYLYYVPQEKIIVTLPNGGTEEMHSRELYKLDTETGEQTVIFRFDGDYSALQLGNKANDLIVHDNKIYTFELYGKIATDEGKDPKYLNMRKGGLIIIDIETGDINRVTADYVNTSNGMALEWKSEIIPMDLANEK